MEKIISLAVAAILVLVMFTGCSSENDTIVVGAKDYTEQDILGNLLTVLIQENTDLNVTFKNEMSSNVVFEAIKSGEIDVYIDYTGTLYGVYLGYNDTKTADEIYDIVVSEFSDRFSLDVLEPLGFNNTYTLSVRQDTAEQLGLTTFSDLAKVSNTLNLGATFEILNRNDGVPNLKEMYQMEFASETALDGTLRYTALESDEVQVIDAFSTDALLMEYDLFVLEDDLNYFPAYHAVPIISHATAEKYPEVQEAVEVLTGLLDEETMRGLNYQVDVLARNPKDVAKEFAQEKGLIS